jgi:hypothetical protein
VRFLIGSCVAFALVIATTRLLVLGLVVARHGRSIDADDLACWLGGGALLLLAAVLPVAAVRWLARRSTLLATLAALPLGAALSLAALLELLGAWVFFEWGAFLERAHVEAGLAAGVEQELADYLSIRRRCCSRPRGSARRRSRCDSRRGSGPRAKPAHGCGESRSARGCLRRGRSSRSSRRGGSIRRRPIRC